MARWLAIPGVLIVAVTLLATAAIGIGRSMWNRGSLEAVSRMEEATRQQSRAGGPTVEATPLDTLPPPVARYLRFALPPDRPAACSARIRWSGQFRMRPDAGWVPFTAAQHFTTRPPGFVWDARIEMMPLISIRVRDGYWAEAGTMLGRIAAVMPVVDEGGTPEMAQSALARWLGEAVWFPSALLPGGPVRWEAVDGSSARATVVDGETRASAEFHFAPTGEIERVTALRYRDVDGTVVLTPFEGRLWDYARREGVMVPTRAEVAWILPDGRFPYWRGTPDHIKYRTDSAP